MPRCQLVMGKDGGQRNHRAVYAHKPLRRAGLTSLSIASALQETVIIPEMTTRRLIAHAARYVF
jgi:hypothetical protein